MHEFLSKSGTSWWKKKKKINIHVFFGGEILLKYYERI